ncbi:MULTISPECIES: hypothetical protein [unclassified Nonomuraea]|uniref:hypothetical protein n=1 Tax=unclassified Nonomuraea TaxID=2593643 RepID=UPI00340C7A6D
MCGACGGDRGGADWARPWVAGPAARAAVATAVARLRPSSRTRISPAAGGWLARRPTGGSTVCATLAELVAAVRSASPGPAAPPDPARPSGRLAVPAPADGRTGVVLRVDPHAPPRDLTGALCGGIHAPARASEAAPGPGLPSSPAAADSVRPADPSHGDLPRDAEVVVPDQESALGVLALLATPVWLRRLYLARVEGVSAPWGDHEPPRPSDFPLSAEFGADALVRLEWERQEGRADDTAVALRWPLGHGAVLDVEIRAGHVVRARTLRPSRGR